MTASPQQTRPVRSQYEDFMRHVYMHGTPKTDRTGTGTRSVFGHQMRFDLNEGFPLVTTKKVHFKSILLELLWFLEGSSSNKRLQEMGCTIWDEWAAPDTIPMTPGRRMDAFTEILKSKGYVGTARLTGIPPISTERIQELKDEKYFVYTADQLESAMAEHGVPTEEANPAAGDLGPVYGVQWRSWPNKGKKVFKEYTWRERIAKARQIGQTMPNNLWYESTVPWTTRPRELQIADELHALEQYAHEAERSGDTHTLKQINDKLIKMAFVLKGEERDEAIDQLAGVIDTLKTNPDSRRMLVSAWNVADLDKMALMPCHALFQFYSQEMTFNERYRLFERMLCEHTGRAYVDLTDAEILARCPDGEATSYSRNGAHTAPIGKDLDTFIPKRRLSCQLYQRSADIFLGVPFNIASYALLTHMVAQQTNHAVGDFIWTGGDCHIYSNHTEQAELQLSRSPYPYPTLKIKRTPDSIDGYKFEDFELVDYQYHPGIKGDVAK